MRPRETGFSRMKAEPNMAVSDRHELRYLLTEASRFEHTVMCTCLYAQWSLKKDKDAGLTAEEKEAIGFRSGKS